MRGSFFKRALLPVVAGRPKYVSGTLEALRVDRSMGTGLGLHMGGGEGRMGSLVQ